MGEMYDRVEKRARRVYELLKNEASLYEILTKISQEFEGEYTEYLLRRDLGKRLPQFYSKDEILFLSAQMYNQEFIRAVEGFLGDKTNWEGTIAQFQAGVEKQMQGTYDENTFDNVSCLENWLFSYDYKCLGQKITKSKQFLELKGIQLDIQRKYPQKSKMKRPVTLSRV